VTYRGKNIAEVLDLTIDEAFEFFDGHSAIREKLHTLQLVGLGYMTLGQSATTLLGGESQRVKLAKELSSNRTEHVIYLLDEPTTGLHFYSICDIKTTLIMTSTKKIQTIDDNNKLMSNGQEYRAWLIDLKTRYQHIRIKASIKINYEVIFYYWSVGRDIVIKKAESKWGSGFYDNLSRDLRRELPDVQGLSKTNLKYMKYFYDLFPDVFTDKSIRPQLVDELH